MTRAWPAVRDASAAGSTPSAGDRDPPGAGPMTQRIWRGQLYALVAMALWSTNYIIGRYLRADVSPGTIAAFRALVAGVPLALWILGSGAWRREHAGRDSRPAGAVLPGAPRGAIIGQLIGLGALGIFASQYLTYLALHWSQATNVIILNAASPLVTAGMAVAAGVTAFSPGLFGGLAISVIGAALVIAFGASGGAHPEFDLGALLVIGSMFTWGAYNLGVQRLSRALPPLAITAGAMLAGVPFLLAAIAVEYPPHLLATVRTHLPILLYLAIGPSAVAYACWNSAVRDLGADYAMLSNNLLPIFGMLLGSLLLHERVTIVQVLASALIIGGILIAFRSLIVQTAPAPSAGPAPEPGPGRG